MYPCDFECVWLAGLFLRMRDAVNTCVCVLGSVWSTEASERKAGLKLGVGVEG